MGISLVCLAASLWATVGVANGLMSDGAAVSPALFGLMRTALGGLCLLAVAHAMKTPRPQLRDFPFAALCVFAIGGAVFQICLFAAFVRVGVTITVAVTVCAPPMIVAVADALHRRRVPDAGLLTAIAVAAGGVVLVLRGHGNLPDEAARIGVRGVALLAGASFGFAALAVAARLMAQRLHPVRAAGLGLVATATLLAAIVAGRHVAGIAAFPALSWGDLGILVYVGVVATGGAYLAFGSGMRLSRSACTGLVATMVEPALAALFAAFLLQERLDRPQLAGCLLMLVAMALLARSERAAPPGTRD